MTSSPVPANPSALRWWLIMLTLSALLCTVLGLVFGWLINMDTQIEMNPRGDPLVRQDAIGFRLFAWGGVAVFILMMCIGLIGSWSAYRRRRLRPALGWSLLAAVPMYAVAVVYLYFVVTGAQ